MNLNELIESLFFITIILIIYKNFNYKTNENLKKVLANKIILC